MLFWSWIKIIYLIRFYILGVNLNKGIAVVALVFMPETERVSNFVCYNSKLKATLYKIQLSLSLSRKRERDAVTKLPS